MNADPFAFLDEIQMAFSDASNHAKAAIADVDRYVMPPVSYAEFVDDTLRALSACADVSYEELVGDIRWKESAGPSERQA